MTMLSPLGRVPDRPVRRRTSRRAWPLLAFILVFAIAAGVVWWRVFTSDSNGKKSNASCSSTSATGTTLDPHDIQLRVYNATNRTGLARKTGAALRARGLNVLVTGNDPTKRKVTGVAEIRHGSTTVPQAKLLLAVIPGATPVPDRRTDAVLDIVLGPKFRALAARSAMDKAIRTLASTTPSASGC